MRGEANIEIKVELKRERYDKEMRKEVNRRERGEKNDEYREGKRGMLMWEWG